jgi:hypothetical protein
MALLFTGVILPFVLPGLPTIFVAATLIGSGFMLAHMISNNLVGEYGKPEDRRANFVAVAGVLLGFARPAGGRVLHRRRGRGPGLRNHGGLRRRAGHLVLAPRRPRPPRNPRSGPPATA